MIKLFHYIFQKLFGGMISLEVHEGSLSAISYSFLFVLSFISSTFYPPMLLIIRITLIFFLIVFQFYRAF